MVSKTDMLALVRNLTKRRPVMKRELVSPSRDWGIMLVVFILCVAIGGGWVAVHFVRYQNVDQLKGVEATHIPRYRESQALDALDAFRSRSTKFVSLVNDRPNVLPVNTLEATSTDEVATTSTAVE